MLCAFRPAARTFFYRGPLGGSNVTAGRAGAAAEPAGAELRGASARSKLRIQHSSVLQAANEKPERAPYRGFSNPSTHNMTPRALFWKVHFISKLPLVAALSHARVGPSRSRAAEDNDVT